MSSLALDRSISTPAHAGESKLAVRFVLGLFPALVLMAAWGDFARSVMIGDELTPQMAQTAARALQAGPQSYESLRQDLSASLSRRMDLNSVDVSMAARQQDSLTVNVQAQVPSRFLPQLVPAYQIERSATACRLQNIQIDGAQC
jgi:hypothetical protein